MKAMKAVLAIHIAICLALVTAIVNLNTAIAHQLKQGLDLIHIGRVALILLTCSALATLASLALAIIVLFLVKEIEKTLKK